MKRSALRASIRQLKAAWQRAGLQTRMILVIGLLVLSQVGILGYASLRFIGDSLEAQIGQRALRVAQTVAQIPQIRAGLLERDPSLIQPLAERIRQQTGAEFIVVGDRQAIRYSHPVAERIGQPMVGGDNEAALQRGLSYVSRATGTLGPSIRGKTPVVDAQGRIIGLVSVGYLVADVGVIVAAHQRTLLMAMALILALGVVAAALIAKGFKKAIFGLEPAAIARLFEERSAILESIREGIIAINDQGLITSVNKTALDTLGYQTPQQLIGQPIKQIIPESRMQEVLESGQAQFDIEFELFDQVIIANRIPLLIDNEIKGVVVSFRKKDDIEQLSRQLSQLTRYAEMLRVQTHEYSNKLSTIAGLIQLGAHDKAIELISHETSGYQELIQFLLQAVPDPVLAGLLLGKYNRAKELGLELMVDRDSSMQDLPDALPREKLVTIIGNLLDNAFDACLAHPASSKRVLLSMTDIGDDLIFEIEDSGSGIRPEDEVRIFAKGVSSKPGIGRGVGLYLVRQTLAQLQGTLSLSRAAGGGSIFTLYIPKNKKKVHE